MNPYWAVSTLGVEEFLTPFAAATHLNRNNVAGTVEVGPRERRTKLWTRTPDGVWDLASGRSWD